MSLDFSTACPSTRELKSWLENGLQEEDSPTTPVVPPLQPIQAVGQQPPLHPGDTIQLHLQQCDRCRAQLDRLTDALGPDEGRWHVRSVVPAEPLPEERPLLEQVKARLLPLWTRGATSPCEFPAAEQPSDGAALQGPHTRRSARAQLQPGTTWEHYELEEPLGRGTTGEIYRAWDHKLQRTVALKVVRERLLGERELARWKHEAIALAGLDHPHVVRVLGPPILSDQGLAALPLEYLEDGSLADRIRRSGALPWRDAAARIEQAARGLQAIHDAGLVHRDLKPGNVLLSGEVAKIGDLGLARTVAESQRLTRTGDLLGTPAYLAPEQCLGEPATIASDVYALGTTLYECLTGKPPFQGTPAGLLQTIPGGVRQPPRQLDPSISRELEVVCLTAMSLRPTDRYPTAAAFADDLARTLRGEPIVARAPNTLQRLWRWGRRRPLVALLATALVVSTVVGVGTTFVQWRRAERNWQRAERMFAESEQRGRAAERQRRLLAEKQQQLRDSVDVFSSRLLEDPGFRDGISAPVRDEIWRNLITSYRQFLAESKADARHDLSVIEKLNKLADLGLEMGLYTRAGEALQAAQAGLHELGEAPANPAESVKHYELLTTHASLLAEFLATRQQYQAAQEWVERGLAYAQQWSAAVGDSEAYSCNRRILRLRYQQLANAYALSADTASSADKNEMSDTTSLPQTETRLLGDLREFVRRWTDKPEPRLDLARAIRTLAKYHTLEDAIAMRQESDQLLRQSLQMLQATSDEHTKVLRDTSVNQALLGSLLAGNQNLPAAQQAFQRALQGQEKLLEYQPNHHQWRNDHLETLVLLARTYDDQPSLKRSWLAQAAQQSEALQRMAPKDYHVRRRAIQLWLEIQGVDQTLEAVADAASSLEEAMRQANIYLQLKAAYPVDVAWLVPLMRTLASTLQDQGETQRAESWNRQAQQWLETSIQNHGSTPELESLR